MPPGSSSHDVVIACPTYIVGDSRGKVGTYGYGSILNLVPALSIYYCPSFIGNIRPGYLRRSVLYPV